MENSPVFEELTVCYKKRLMTAFRKYQRSELMKIKFLILLITALSAAAFGQNETDCELAAFVADPASGINIRADAGLEYGIVTKIPADENGTLVMIEGARGDWLKISSAINSKKTKVFSGTGWIYAPLVSVRLPGYEGFQQGKMKVYRSPNESSEKINYTSFGINAEVHGCQGDWFKVRLPVTGTGVSGYNLFGWVTSGGFCGSPWEDCM